MSNEVAISPVTGLRNFLEKNKAQIAAALPKHLNPDRMCRLALTAFSQNRALEKCELNTIFASVVIASQLGLEIGIAGQGFLVPYKGRCTFIPGWQGLVDLVSRSGRAAVWTGAVFEGDEFDWALGDRPYVKHKPQGEDNIGKLTHTYAVGRAKGSDWPIIEVWAQDRLVSHRNKYNKVGDDHYSFKSWEMYARKIPLLQVIKYLPKSIELANAIALEGAYAEGKTAVLDGDFVRVDEPAQSEPPVEQPEVRNPAAPQTTGTASALPNGAGASQESAPEAGQKKGQAPTLDDCKALLNSQGKDALTTVLDWKKHLSPADQVELEKLVDPIRKAAAPKPEKPLQDGQKKILLATIKRSAKSKADVEEKFGKWDELKEGQFNDIQKWLESDPL